MTMRNRNTVVVAFLLVAVMILAVGYAALTDVFTISGTANVLTNQSSAVFDAKIYFLSAQYPTKEAGTTTGTSGILDAASVGSDPDQASFTVNSLALKDEYAIFTFVIKNESEFAATIAITQEPSSNSGYFDTDVAFPNGNTIAAGGELTVQVTTTLIKNVTETINVTTTIKMTATTVDPTN